MINSPNISKPCFCQKPCQKRCRQNKRAPLMGVRPKFVKAPK